MPKERIYGREDLVYGVPGSSHRRRVTDVLVEWGKDGGVYVGLEGRGDYDSPAYSALDRAGLNRLISKLRRARDAAYGRDE